MAWQEFSVLGQLAVQVGIDAQDVGQGHGVGVIGLRPCHRERIDRVHRPTGCAQRGDQQSAWGFDRHRNRVLDPVAGGGEPWICSFIDQMRARKFRVESICRMLTEQDVAVAGHTYRNWKKAAPSAKGLYGRRQMTAHLCRQGHQGRSVHRGPADG